jgi:RNA polymerase sigma factor (sigma-70 family)
MEALAKVSSDTAIKQRNSIAHKHPVKEVCKNRIDMPFKELIKHISKKLMGYAMVLTMNNQDDAWDLIQTAIEKLLKNEDKLMASDQPMAYAKRIMYNSFVDIYRKEKRLVSIEANEIEVTAKGFQDELVEYQEMLSHLQGFDKTDQIILSMLGAGHSYKEIKEVVGDISMANLRVKANRARINLANCMGRKL